MSCYIDTPKAPNQREYETWRGVGFTGSYEDYLDAKRHAGGRVFVCGDLGGHCADCAGFGDFLCDYPVGDGKTCDRPMCENHAREVAPNVHYCAGHFAEWRAFVEKGGVAEHLRNVVAYKKPW